MAPMRQPTVSRSQKFSPYPKSASIAKVTCKSTTSKPAKPAKASKPEKAIFRGLSVTIAGNIINSKGESEPYENIIRWFRLHGGTYDQEVQSDTTHLICSIEEYKARGPQVKKAWAAQTQKHRVHIVVFDWLEDSLLSNPKKKRAEKGYTLDRTIARLKKGKSDHLKFRKSFEDGVRASKDLCDNRLHRVYYDQTGFEYKIVLTRLDKSSEKIRCEKYTLFLFMSIAAPHTFMFGAKLSRQYRPNSFYREDCRPKTFQEAFKDFKHFFKAKTDIEWDDRLEGIRKEKVFVYTPPILGRPVGVVKSGYIRPEWREKELDVEYDTDSEVEDDDDEDTDISTDRNTTSTITGAEDDISDATAAEASPSGPQDIIPYFNPQYGFQPDVIDERLVTDNDINGQVKTLENSASVSDVGEYDYKEEELTSSVSSSTLTSFTIAAHGMSPKREQSSATATPPTSQNSSVYIDLTSD